MSAFVALGHSPSSALGHWSPVPERRLTQVRRRAAERSELLVLGATGAAVWLLQGRRSCRSSAARSALPRREAALAGAGLLVAACAVPDEASALFGMDDGGSLMREGMMAFTRGKVAESVSLFDASAEKGYPKAMLWQRGLSLYYVDRFEEGAKQFREDVALNPNDTEESVWAMLCEARMLGFEEARKRMLVVGRDSRKVMRTVYAMYRGEDEAANKATLEQLAQEKRGGSDAFYSALYLGLFAEAQGDSKTAQKWIERAVSTPYTLTSGDYMADLAKVHQQVRGWSKA